jgi:heme oxygenase
MLARLDRENGSLHTEADQGWRRLLHDSDVARDDYIHQLTVTYGFESPFEAACSYTPGLAQVIDLRGRWRSGLIAQDLLALGSPPGDIPMILCSSVAPFRDAAEALAWMYVVERPTLIYSEIRDDLTSRFVDLTRAMTYLSAYEGTTSKRWSELGIALDLLCVSDRVCKRVVESVRAAFQSLIEWQRRNSPGLRHAG